MPFLKEDLVGQHYNWSSTINPSALTGQPSRRFFDKFNGNQVLFIINSCESVADKFTLADARKMEELISHYLPDEAKSEMSVFNWLKEVCAESLHLA
jgi:hypothetical protein